jgi:hypothetical protein
LGVPAAGCAFIFEVLGCRRRAVRFIFCGLVALGRKRMPLPSLTRRCLMMFGKSDFKSLAFVKLRIRIYRILDPLLRDGLWVGLLRLCVLLFFGRIRTRTFGFTNRSMNPWLRDGFWAGLLCDPEFGYDAGSKSCGFLSRGFFYSKKTL